MVEGESLANDGTGLVIYAIAVGVVSSGEFSLAGAVGEFALSSVGGIAIGLAVAWVVTHVRRRLDDAPIEITLSLVTPFLAYIPADHLGVSGVLAAVAAGLYAGWQAPTLYRPSVRIQAQGFWEMLTFLLNGLLFLLIGLQLKELTDRLEGQSAGELIGYVAIVAGVVLGVRLAWLLTVGQLARLRAPGEERGQALPRTQELVAGWSGMRGVVSLAAALALPLEAMGGPFPQRDLIIFIAFGVIAVSVIGQGSTLPLLLRRLDLRDEHDPEREEAGARLRATQAALDRLDELSRAGRIDDEDRERARTRLERRIERVQAPAEGARTDRETTERHESWRELQSELLEAELDELLSLRDDGELGAETMRAIQRDLDLEHARLEGG